MCGPAMVSTFASQLRSGSLTSPTPPGPASTAPTLIVGSTAFIAAAKALKLLPYAVGDKAGLIAAARAVRIGSVQVVLPIPIGVDIGVIAIAVDFVADFPVLDPNGSVAIDGQEIVLVVGVLGGRHAAEPGPVTHRSPIVSFGVDAEGNVIGRAIEAGVAVGIGDPGGGFLRLAAHRGLVAGAVVYGDHSLAPEPSINRLTKLPKWEADAAYPPVAV